VTDFKDQLMPLFGDEPAAPDDLERIVSAGRRARRRHQAAMVAAGTVGAAGLSAAVAVPLVARGGGDTPVTVSVRPSPTPTAAPGHCELFVGAGNQHRAVNSLAKKAAAGGHGWVTRKIPTHGGKTLLEVCPKGVPWADATTQANEPPAGPPYHYTEQPQDIASRLGTHLHDRVTGFGLPITYTRPFAQESTKLESGRPSYYDGNVDVHEAQGYGDIGVQVTHTTTQQVPFDGSCTADAQCEETTLPDGSVLRTGQVKAGRGDVVLTAEVHRPDGVIVQAQESNYPFGPGTGTQAHGDQPLSLDQLVSLAEDPHFTF
jgi:hypothetical protein